MYKYIFLLVFLPVVFLHSENTILVRVPGSIGTYNGSIKQATLVIEPHGSYLEQSLYIEYINTAIANNTELIHRFILPEGTIANDMWLWVGDSIMQARVLDTWKAHAVFDTSVQIRRVDPAYLFKQGNQYELRVFPVPVYSGAPNSVRKVKINFITKVNRNADVGEVNLPMNLFLGAQEALSKLIVSFRTPIGVQANPRIVELPSAQFSSLPDTAGYHYDKLVINNPPTVTSLRLQYNQQFNGGVFFRSSEKFNGFNNFAFQVQMAKLFGLQSITSARKVHIAVDLSGSLEKWKPGFKQKLIQLVTSHVKSIDSVKLTFAGRGLVQPIVTSWVKGDSVSIKQLFDGYFAGTEGSLLLLPEVISVVGTPFGILNSFRVTSDLSLNIKSYANSNAAVSEIANADVYICGDGKWQIFTQDPEPVVNAMNTMMSKGGTVIFPFRLMDKIMEQYYPNATLGNLQNMVMYSKPEGTFGRLLPAQLNSVMDFFDFTSTNNSFSVEAVSSRGLPVVLSKKIGNGTLIITCDLYTGALRGYENQSFHAFARLFRSKFDPQWKNLLEYVKNTSKTDNTNEVFFISNTEDTLSGIAAREWVSQYVQEFNGAPQFHGVNLLTNEQMPVPYIKVLGRNYLGISYVINQLAEKTGGSYFSRGDMDWQSLLSNVQQGVTPNTVWYDAVVKGNNTPATIKDFYRVDNAGTGTNGTWSFVGSTSAQDSVTLEISAKFTGNDSLKTKTISGRITPPLPSVVGTPVIQTLIANEKINNLFAQSPVDTAAIVDLAIGNRILCDFSAFLALEPNDTTYAIHPQFNEIGYVPVENLREFNDSVYCNAYPNPFNAMVTLQVHVGTKASEVTVKVFNLLGQEVVTLANAELLQGGSKIYRWNTTDSFNTLVTSGVYFTRVEVKELASGKQTVRTNKLILLK